jgi:hypothetical protein
MAIGRDPRTKRPNAQTKLFTKSACFLALISGFVLYNGFQKLSGIDMGGQGRMLEETAKAGLGEAFARILVSVA